MVESADDQRRRELSEARRLKRQVEEFLQHPVWLHLANRLNYEIAEARAAYETPVGRGMDELVKNEANRGAIAASRSVLSFPQQLLDSANNTIALFADHDRFDTHEEDEE